MTRRDVLRGTCALMLGLVSTVALAQAPSERRVDLMDLSLEELMRVEIKSSGLTETDLRRAPVALMELSADAVESSGARDLNHLLEMYVPNLQMIDHHHLQSHLGFRGIISDREDKYLFQVNGRTMNNRMFVGADNERAIPLLGDIRQVSVVRGPASATDGAGALAGVIDLATYTGLTFQGADLNVRAGAGDRFTAAEGRFGRKFGARAGLFVYYGVADQPGADSGYYIGSSYPARNGLPANVAGQRLQAPTARYGAAGFAELRHKAHVSYVTGPLELWGRFVQDGNQNPPLREIFTAAKPEGMSLEDWIRGRQFRNRQLTFAATLTRQLAPRWTLTLMESFDRWDAKERRMGNQLNAPAPRDAGEKEAFTRGIVNWAPNASHSLAFGGEYSREWFSDPFVSDALDRAPAVAERDWSTNTVSFLAEYQWKISPRWTSFVSARGDKHTYSDLLLSPRVSLVFTPNERDTWTFMAGRSVRRGIDSELWAEHVRLGTIPRPESLRSYEVSYSRTVSSSVVAGANAVFEDYDALGWVPALYLSTSLGRFHMAGGEARVTITRGRTRVVLSEGLTKLIRASVPADSPPAGQAISARPYGYGTDLANWARFIGKAVVQHDLSEKWTATTSLIHYSGFGGAKDYAAYASTFAAPPSAIPLSDPGFNAPYGPNLYWNLGLAFQATEKWKLRLDGYNLIAPMDPLLSKRNYYFRLSEFSEQPASLAASVRYQF